MTILPNGVAVIDGDTHHAVWCAEQGLIHDRWMADEICKHLKPGDTAIDGGANIGTLTRAMLDAGAAVVAVDANIEALKCLKVNCPGDMVFAMCGALSDAEGAVAFVSDVNAGASCCSTLDSKDQPSVQTIIIDRLPIGDVKLIKLDIEGYEPMALRGARDTIRRCKPVLFVEVNAAALVRAGESEDSLLRLIEELGYDWKIMQWQCKRGDEQYDVECLPKNSSCVFTKLP